MGDRAVGCGGYLAEGWGLVVGQELDVRPPSPLAPLAPP